MKQKWSGTFRATRAYIKFAIEVERRTGLFDLALQ